MAAQRVYEKRIVKNPAILGGKPIIKGTRISVELILGKLAVNLDWEELLVDYPRLKEEDVKACIDYAQFLVSRQRKARRSDRELLTLAMR